MKKIKSVKVDNFAVSQWWLKTRKRDEFGEKVELEQHKPIIYNELGILSEKIEQQIREADRIEAEQEGQRKNTKGLHALIKAKEQTKAI